MVVTACAKKSIIKQFMKTAKLKILLITLLMFAAFCIAAFHYHSDYKEAEHCNVCATLSAMCASAELFVLIVALFAICAVLIRVKTHLSYITPLHTSRAPPLFL